MTRITTAPASHPVAFFEDLSLDAIAAAVTAALKSAAVRPNAGSGTGAHAWDPPV